MAKFPAAKRVDPVYQLEGDQPELFKKDQGALFRRVDASAGINNPEAIRASVPITKGEDKGGMKIIWLVPLTMSAPPATVPLDTGRKPA